MSNINIKERKKPRLLLVTVVALAVAIIFTACGGDKPETEDADAKTEEVQSEGLVVEDTATVEVDIDEPTTGAAAEE